MEENKKLDEGSMHKIAGGYRTDEDGNQYYMDLGIDGDACVSCGLCLNNCPVQCISYNGSYAVIDISNCIRCGYCYNLCPVNAIGDNRKVIVR